MRIDGDVGAIGGVGGGAQLRAIFFAGLRDASGEFDDRFPAGNYAEDVGEAFDGCELLVGVEDVEFGFVGREGGASILLHVVFAVLRGGVERVGKIGGAIGGELGDGFFEERAIVREVREDRELRAKSDDGDEVGLGHLLLDEFFGGVVGADQIVGLHGGEIEEQDDQAAVAHLIAGRGGGGRVGAFLSTETTMGFASTVAAVSTCFDVFE